MNKIRTEHRAARTAHYEKTVQPINTEVDFAPSLRVCRGGCMNLSSHKAANGPETRKLVVCENTDAYYHRSPSR